MARSHLCLALLALVAMVATVQGRSVLQFQAQAFCPDGCNPDGGCVQDSTKGGLRCQQCLGNLVVNQVTGNCACPAGKYATAATATDPPQCVDCPKGSWCAGSDYYLPSNDLNPLKTDYPGTTAPRAQQCPVTASGNMTTNGRRATSIRACVNLPGTYYSISADGSTIDQTTCPVNTYSPGLKKQRACVPCPTGYTTNGVTGATSPTQCVIPAGYYLKGPGQVAPCPKGEWKSGVGLSANCTKCAFGVTTLAEASTSIDNCTIVVPGYFAAAVSNGIVTSTLACPQNYFCIGGRPTRAFNPASPNPDASCPAGGPGTICACPSDTWTQDIAATNVEQCLTPPGHFTNGTGTYKCSNGTYRADWKPIGDAAAAACLSCGEGVKTVATDQLAVYATNGYAETKLAVTTSSDDCYIQSGQGLYYTTLTKSWRAKNCTVNSYGVANQTFGLTPSPCRDCPTNMVTALTGNNATYSVSAAYFTSLGDTMGFTDVDACVTQPGYGMSGRNAQPCDKGYWNTPNNYDTCKACAFGLTTQGSGKGVNESSCGIALGYGNVDGTIMPCPIGTYNDVEWNANRSAECKPCGTGLTTVAEGSTSAAACNLCKPGYGGTTDCSGMCGGEGASATYGPPGRSTDTDPQCLSCTTQSTGYSFDYNMGNDIYSSPAVSKDYANSSTDCVAKYSQLVDGAWFIPIPSNDPAQVLEVSTGVTTFAACADSCTAANNCQYVTYDYQARTCTVRKGLPPTYVGSPLIAYKNLPSGDVGTNAWSEEQPEEVKAKLVTTGVYTFYRDEFGENVGTPVDPLDKGYNITAGVGPQYLQNCLNACDNEVQCFGIRILMNVVVADRPTTCKLLYGNTNVGQFKRTVMRADVLKMPLPSLSDL